MKIDPERAIRVEDLLGRQVRTQDGSVLGRIEEIRAERNGEVHEVMEYHLGSGALIERLGVLSRVLRRGPRTYVVRWDQLDLSRPREPRLTCDVSAIKTKRK